MCHAPRASARARVTWRAEYPARRAAPFVRRNCVRIFGWGPCISESVLGLADATTSLLSNSSDQDAVLSPRCRGRVGGVVRRVGAALAASRLAPRAAGLARVPSHAARSAAGERARRRARAAAQRSHDDDAARRRGGGGSGGGRGGGDGRRRPDRRARGCHRRVHQVYCQDARGRRRPERRRPSIVLFTLLVKGITFPLNYQQISSTTKMQAIQPRTKEIQAQCVWRAFSPRASAPARRNPCFPRPRAAPPPTLPPS